MTEKPDTPPFPRKRLLIALLGIVFAPFLVLILGLYLAHTLVEMPSAEIPILVLSVITGCFFVGLLPIQVWIRWLIGMIYAPVYTFALFLCGWTFLANVLERPMRLW